MGPTKLISPNPPSVSMAKISVAIFNAIAIFVKNGLIGIGAGEAT